MNIFDIQNKIDIILEQAAENGGDIGESCLEELAIAEEDLADKLYAYSFICDRYDTDISLLKQYKEALDDRIKRSENKKGKLRDIIADCVWKYGEPVLKKNKDTGEKEETGSYSLKYPNISLTVKKIKDIEADEKSVNEFLKKVYDFFNYPSVDTTLPNIDKIKSFLDVKLSSGFDLDKASAIKDACKEKGIQFQEEDFRLFINNKNLKQVLDTSPENLDAWNLIEKNSVTIRK